MAAVPFKNQQFFFLAVLLDQHAVDPDAQQFEVAKRIAFLDEAGLAAVRAQKSGVTGDPE